MKSAMGRWWERKRQYNAPMTPTDFVPTTYDEAVNTLSEWHAELDRPDLQIFSFPDPDGILVRLIEVSEEFPSSDQVRPITFGASKEFPFRSSVALATPAEWQKVLDGELLLPEGWNVEDRKRVWPHEGA